MHTLQDIASYIGFSSVPHIWAENLVNLDDIKSTIAPHFSQENMAQALKFYDIDDVYFIDKINQLANKIKTDSLLQDYVFLMHYLLFLNVSAIPRKSWKLEYNKTIINRHENFYFNALVILSGYSYHQAKKYDIAQQNAQKQMVKRACFKDKHMFNVDGTSFSQMLWGCWVITGNIIAIERLEFERDFFDKDMTFTRHNYQKNTSCIKIHIPADGQKLDAELVKKSLKNAKPAIEQYFNLKNVPLVCQSWLLSETLPPLVNKDSNIMHFQHLFDIQQGKIDTKHFLSFIFGIPFMDIDMTTLPESTSLQKQIKPLLIKGQDLYSGYGLLKND